MTSGVKLVYHGVFKKRVRDVEVELNNPEAMLGDLKLFLEPKMDAVSNTTEIVVTLPILNLN